MTISADGIVTHPSGRIIVSLHEVDVRPLIGTSWRSRGSYQANKPRLKTTDNQHRRNFMPREEEKECERKTPKLHILKTALISINI